MKSLGAIFCRPFTQCCGAPAAPKDKAEDAGKAQADAKSDAVDVSSKRGQPVETVNNTGLDKPRISDTSDATTVSESSTTPPSIPADVAAPIVPAQPVPATSVAPGAPEAQPASGAPIAVPVVAPKSKPVADVPSSVAGMPTPAVDDETSSLEDSSSENSGYENVLPEIPRHELPALPTAEFQPTPHFSV